MDKFCPGSPDWALIKPAIGVSGDDLVVPVGFVPETAKAGAEEELEQFQKDINITV